VVTRTDQGKTIYYDNVGMGWAKNPNEDDSVYLVFTDKDNEEVHLVPVAISKLEQFFQLGRQTIAGQKIEVVTADRGPT